MFKRVVIWGHKLGTHTHGYIHDGFYRTFASMGYDVLWLDDDDDVSDLNFENNLFLTEGQVDKNIPLLKSCKYVIHNCCDKYDEYDNLKIQYLTRGAWDYEEISHGIKYNDRCLHFPWGSPLLQHEFDFNDVKRRMGQCIYFIGTVNGKYENGNYSPIIRFAISAASEGKKMYVGGGYTGEQHYRYLNIIKNISKDKEAYFLRTAYMAPALQGNNQLKNGMIPCRLFKAISYGNDGITNNDFAYEFFDGNVVYNIDPYMLFFDALKVRKDKKRILSLMAFVKDKHTYVNNINAIIKVL
jgi:hypothetical protein